jgi:hypothetical protein
LTFVYFEESGPVFLIVLNSISCSIRDKRNYNIAKKKQHYFHILSFIYWQILRTNSMVSTFNLYLQVFLVVKELFTLPELMRSTPTLSGVHVARSWVFCEVFCRSLFVPLSFFFDQCIVTPLVSSNLSLSLSHTYTHPNHICLYI